MWKYLNQSWKLFSLSPMLQMGVPTMMTIIISFTIFLAIPIFAIQLKNLRTSMYSSLLPKKSTWILKWTNQRITCQSLGMWTSSEFHTKTSMRIKTKKKLIKFSKSWRCLLEVGDTLASSNASRSSPQILKSIPKSLKFLKPLLILTNLRFLINSSSLRFRGSHLKMEIMRVELLSSTWVGRRSSTNWLGRKSWTAIQFCGRTSCLSKLKKFLNSSRTLHARMS